ncbi:recombination regulator RecX [Paraburkholderia sp. J67]|uniref:recombination regulator RecX n=1 Tax=Paraburkholderia sp. J67 TaxID=2805435 RepID=UPI002ABE24A2|nr:recombination regulator RecX [Paraburkholderia sp. J67]
MPHDVPHDLDDEGGAVFEVPFEAFFDAPADGTNTPLAPSFESQSEYTREPVPVRQSRQSRRTPEASTHASNRAPARVLPRTSRQTNRRDDFDDESFDAHDLARAAALAGEAPEPEGDRYERTSATRAARKTAAASSSSSRQRPERSLKGRALGYLSRREYSRAELSRKLMSYTEDADELEVLLDALERDGWLSDARFAESVVYRRAARVGAGRIVSELKRHAVGDALIEEVNTQLRETELTRARAVWQKKYGQLPETPAERARQARFLAARGFSMSVIGKILKGIEDDFDGGFDSD